MWKFNNSKTSVCMYFSSKDTENVHDGIFSSLISMGDDSTKDVMDTDKKYAVYFLNSK